MKRQLLVFAQLLLAGVVGCGSGSTLAGAALESAPDTIIVMLEHPEDDGEIEDVRKEVEGVSIERIGDSSFFVLRFPPGADLAEIMKHLDDDLRVVGSDLDYFGSVPEGGPSDVPILGSDLFSSIPTQSSLGPLALAAAHVRSMGAGVLVAVIDTGVDFGHPSLAGHLSGAGYDFIGRDADPRDERNFRDDDGDGLVDEQYGHGTFVSSLVLAVAPNATILPVRVLNDDGVGTASSVAAGILWAVDRGARVINLSVDIPQSPEVVQQAVDAAANADVVIVAAAGNEGMPQVIFPARYSRVVAVSAVDDMMHVAPFANRGSEVSLVAPGVRLLGAMPLDKSPSGTARWSGTSFAAPLVAGAAALVRSAEPILDRDAVRQRLEDTAQSVNAMNPLEQGRLGKGLVRPAEALAAGP